MHIYILRHGKAGEAPAGGSDAERRLTPEGVEKLRSVLERARAAQVAPAVILTSPFVRAVETAELAAEILGAPQEVVRSSALVPSSTPHPVWEEIRARPEAAQLLVVGHEPLLSHLIAFLLDCPTLRLEFSAGALAAIQEHRLAPAPAGTLRWILAPSLV